jgi:hypothetical protein
MIEPAETTRESGACDKKALVCAAAYSSLSGTFPNYELALSGCDGTFETEHRTCRKHIQAVLTVDLSSNHMPDSERGFSDEGTGFRKGYLRKMQDHSAQRQSDGSLREPET